MRSQLHWLPAVFLLVGASPAAAQLPIPVALEARAGYALPVGDFADSDIGPQADGGPSFAVGARVDVASSVGIFVEYQQLRFGCSDCGALGLKDSMVLEGVEGGIRLVTPRPVSGFNPWLRAALGRQVLGFSGGDGRQTSAAALGFSLAVGVSIPVTPRLDVSPGARFVSVPADFTFTLLPSVPDRSVDVRGFSVDVGLAFRI